MVDRLIDAIKKLFRADEEKITDRKNVVDESIQTIDKLVVEMNIDRRGFSRQKGMYRGALNTVLEKRGEAEARELGLWITDYIKKHGDTPVRQQVRDKIEHL
ncbi:MAG: hypothetical protein PHD13_07215 [Methanocellales archaeon]|nr:hypothetical protein [Methanocellales archaeon]MDD3292284.1 hypothetical protein [Methanocellales archaeon]MDD5235946.1 hypothetical protein [Methanocellales archaeon]MDD5485830.1 hypothetical protein [Methanocellales archaeon]